MWIVRKCGNPNPIELLIKDAYALYNDKIMSLYKAMWKQEDINGESCEQYKVNQIHAAIYLGVLAYNDTLMGIDWTKRFKLECIDKTLACIGVSLEKILETFELPSNCTCGIECMEIEGSFEVEPEVSPCEVHESFNTPVYQVPQSLFDLLNNGSGCVVNIPQLCNVTC